MAYRAVHAANDHLTKIIHITETIVAAIIAGVLTDSVPNGAIITLSKPGNYRDYPDLNALT